MNYRSSREVLLLFFRITLHALINLRRDIAKETGRSIFYQNSSILMGFKRMVKLIYNKFDHVTTLQTYSQNRYQIQHLQSCNIILEFVNSRICYNKTSLIDIFFQGEIVLFFLRQNFYPTGFFFYKVLAR